MERKRALLSGLSLRGVVKVLFYDIIIFIFLPLVTLRKRLLGIREQKRKSLRLITKLYK